MKKEYKDRLYTIEAYNPTWKRQFDQEARQIQMIFGKLAVRIEHIGSTAIVGLCGKPTTDILVLMQDMLNVDAVSTEMIRHGYKDMGAYVTQDSRLFVKESNGSRLVNVHVFQVDHVHVKEMLWVRDYLRDNPEKVAEYNAVKKSLYAKYPHDYGMYRKYKDEWMSNLMKSFK